MKPLLSATLKDINQIEFPVYASPKLDGVRCLIYKGQPVSRTLKPIPNESVQRLLSDSRLEGLDGELIVGDPTDPRCFNNTQSAVMSKKGDVAFTYHVFDIHHHPELPFHKRLFSAFSVGLEYHESHPFIQPVPHTEINSIEELLKYEDDMLSIGYEGVMIRDIYGKYKHGRSTVKEGILLKMKRFVDSEAEIIGRVELMHNLNQAKVNTLGDIERSSCKDGKVPAGTLGALVVRDLETGVEFNIGTGLTSEDRDTLWSMGEGLIGQLVKYKSFPVGAKDRPRFPTFIGLRDRRDVS